MVSEQEQMKTLQDKILDSTEVTVLLDTGDNLAYRGRGRKCQTFHITTRGLSYLQMVDEMKQNMGLNI
jgi:hypothetical protein